MKPVYEQSDLYKVRHSVAHVLAEAVRSFYPDVKLAIGPPIEDGFYYDFDLGRDEKGKVITFAPEDVERIEAKVKALLQDAAAFQPSSLPIADALALFADQPYKLELIHELAQGKLDENGNPMSEPVSEVGIYRHRAFVDLCRGPHVASTAEIDPDGVKLLRSSGAYWRGDEARPQLQRLYGTAWLNRADLDAYLQRLEAIKHRDHRRLGRELDLFSTNEEIGAGLILWHPKGGLIRKLAEDYWEEEHEKEGYDFVYTPHIGKSSLWQTSGHLDFYKEDMYSAIEIEGQEYYLKPMNCPFHAHIYKSQTRSYRDLPMRLAEKGTVYRYERSGVLHGLLRVRGFTQDDAHHFCRPDQIADELDFVLNFCMNILRAFGLSEFKAYLSTKPEKSVGDAEQWQFAEQGLIAALKRANVPYRVDEGGGAFYGPKIDLAIEDALDREWQISTIQFDFNLPERFDVSYTGEDGKIYRPYMLHRALFGSMERFFGVLIEHYAGAFPLWLAPVQAVVIPIADRHNEYAREVAAAFRHSGLRVQVDDGASRMNAKIRQAQEQKIPYMLIVGDREREERKVAVRTRLNEDRGALAWPDFIAHAQNLIQQKSLEL